jgi:16S rRNA (guanine966-N2)-methyltransferase
VTQVKNKRKSNQLRIIGGEWRGRKLDFPDVPNLRPTGDRIRETLFNWLQMDIPGARCLDLFAGSGALGFEALSRGAAQVTFLDSHAKSAKQLNANCHVLACDNATIIKKDALEFLRLETGQAFNIVFLDPPFQLGMLQESIELLNEKQHLAAGARVYLEMDTATELPFMPVGWQVLKEKKAGQVKYQLWQAA